MLARVCRYDRFSAVMTFIGHDRWKCIWKAAMACSFQRVSRCATNGPGKELEKSPPPAGGPRTRNSRERRFDSLARMRRTHRLAESSENVRACRVQALGRHPYRARSRSKCHNIVALTVCRGTNRLSKTEKVRPHPSLFPRFEHSNRIPRITTGAPETETPRNHPWRCTLPILPQHGQAQLRTESGNPSNDSRKAGARVRTKPDSNDPLQASIYHRSLRTDPDPQSGRNPTNPTTSTRAEAARSTRTAKRARAGRGRALRVAATRCSAGAR